EVPMDYVPDSIVNTATISAAEPDATPEDNSSTATTAVDAFTADISVSKQGATTVMSGQSITYSIVIRNAGVHTASNVMLTDPTPVGLNLLLASAPCSGGFPCALGDIAANASVTLTTTYGVASSIADGARVTNTATASSDTLDPDPSNNSGSTT